MKNRLSLKVQFHCGSFLKREIPATPNEPVGSMLTGMNIYKATKLVIIGKEAYEFTRGEIEKYKNFLLYQLLIIKRTYV